MSKLAGGRPQILLVSEFIPSHTGTGARMRLGAHLSSLAKIGTVDVAIIDEDTPDFQNEFHQALDKFQQEYSGRVLRLPAPTTARAQLRRSRLPAGRLKRLVRYAALPPERALPPSSGETATIIERLRHHRPEIIVCSRILAAVFIGPALHELGWETLPFVVDFDDIESRAYARRIRPQWPTLGTLLSLSNLLQSIRLRRIEARLAKRSSLIVVSSEIDRKILRRRVRSDVEIAVVPNTVIAPPVGGPFRTSSKLRLLFVGTLVYPPNHDGVLWFLREVWPRIRTALGPDGCSLTIVGPYPPDSILAFNDGRHVIVTGRVPSVEPYYDDCDVVIAPIRFGAGTRIKILEAMSHGRPVVSTTMGVEGIPVRKSMQIEISDSCEGFAAEIIRLARNPQAREHMGAAARRFVEKNFSPEVSDHQWRAIVESVLCQKQSG